ncbi:hypothetical protein V1511DRAFT_506792 [Dipodascopsis uninucleata]
MTYVLLVLVASLLRLVAADFNSDYGCTPAIIYSAYYMAYDNPTLLLGDYYNSSIIIEMLDHSDFNALVYAMVINDLIQAGIQPSEAPLHELRTATLRDVNQTLQELIDNDEMYRVLCLQTILGDANDSIEEIISLVSEAITNTPSLRKRASYSTSARSNNEIVGVATILENDYRLPADVSNCCCDMMGGRISKRSAEENMCFEQELKLQAAQKGVLGATNT